MARLEGNETFGKIVLRSAWNRFQVQGGAPDGPALPVPERVT